MEKGNITEMQNSVIIDYTLEDVLSYSGFFNIDNRFRWTDGNVAIILDNILPDKEYTVYLEYFPPLLPEPCAQHEFIPEITINEGDCCKHSALLKSTDYQYLFMFQFAFDSETFRFFRPYVRQVIYRYLDCGLLKNGFARVRCEDCGHEYLLATHAKGAIFAHPWPRPGYPINFNGSFPEQ